MKRVGFKALIVLLNISIILGIIKIINSTKIKKIEQIEYMDINMSQNPINNNIVNNSYFNIDSSGKNASNTTEGLNKALKYCSDANIKYVKLEKGKYLINSMINIPSNICINLNSSTIIMQDNNKNSYKILNISNQENIEIKNGFLKGDRLGHEYIGESTHEWGMGIYIEGGINIEIENISISEMTGDGIYVTSGYRNSKNIRIKNSLLYNNRRQGIGIISGEEIEICNNEIYKIEGTNPQSGIDLEANYETQKIDKVNIYNNKFYNFANNIAILLHNQIYNVIITNNLIYGNINIYETKEKTEIVGNQLINGAINAGSNSENNSRIVNNLDILNNTFENYEILYNENVNNIKIEGNKEN